MSQTTARIKKGTHNFEILVDMQEALDFKKGNSDFLNVEGDRIFRNVKSGEVASKDDLEVSFGTTDVTEIGKRIVKNGEILIDQSHRDEEKEKKIKQVVEFLVTNAIDPQTNNPLTPNRIRSAMQEAHVQVKNVPIENQIQEILDSLSKVIPIKLEKKKKKIRIQAFQNEKA